MKPILILQNCPAETAGIIPVLLRDRNREIVTVRTDLGEPIPDPHDVSEVINLGCPCSVNESMQIDYLRNLYGYMVELVRRDQPYLGICFGGQLLAKVLGADVKPNGTKEIGTYMVSLTVDGSQDALFDGFPATFPVFHWHGDTFGIPFGTERLVEGVDCKNQAFRKGRLCAVQFHLEPTQDEVADWCRVYAHELTETGKSQELIEQEFHRTVGDIHAEQERLIANFLTIANGY